MFKKILVIAVMAFAVVNLFSFSVAPVNAQGISGEIGKQLGAAAGAKGAGFEAPKDPRLIIAQIIKIVLSLLGTIFFVLTLYAGFLWMTAAGNDEQVGKAKSLLFQATMGLTVILAAYGISYFAIRLALGQGQSWDNGVYIQPTPPVTNPSPY